jgi:hypothetical protein
VTKKNVAFWDVALCRSYVNQRFGGTYRLHLQGTRIRKRGTSVSSWLHTEPPVENNQLYNITLTISFCKGILLKINIRGHADPDRKISEAVLSVI